VGGVNEAVVVEMFKAYRQDFRNQVGVQVDDDDEINRRCAYTREHKLAAIDYVENTWERNPAGELVHISRYYAGQKLKLCPSLLLRWIKNKQKIMQQKRGARRLRVKKVGKEPEMEKKLNMEFEVARAMGRVITHRWFTRYVCSLNTEYLLICLSSGMLDRFTANSTLAGAYVLQMDVGL
jgi:hypothetical protein